MNPCSAQSDSILFSKSLELFEAEKFKKSLSAINKAIKINNEKSDYYTLKGSILYQINKDIGELFSFLAKAIEVAPKSPTPLLKRALYYEEIQEFQNAILDYNDALKLSVTDSTLIVIYINRGGLFTKIQKPEHAYDDFSKGYLIDSNNIGLLNNFAMCLDDLNLRDEATEKLIRITQIDSTFVPAWVNLGFQASLKEEFQLSLKYLNKANELAPKQPLTLNNRGYAKLKLNDLEGALIDINKSIELDPRNSYAYRNRALLYIEKKDIESTCENLYLAKKHGFALFYGDEVNNLIKKHCIK